jgi:hypothetical protein
VIRSDVVDALLVDGRTLVSPDGDERDALERLVAAGLVRPQRDLVFCCFDPADDACAYHPTRACSAWVPFDDDDRTFCPACGAEHDPALRQALRDRTTVRVERAALVAWMDAACRRLDATARRLREGVAWSLALPDQDVVVVWLDGSLGSRLVTRAFATGQTVVYVVTSPRTWAARFRDDPWLTPVSVGAWWVEGDRALLAAVARASTGPGLAGEPAMRAWASERAVAPRTVARPLGARRLAVSDVATLDGVEVVARDASGLLPLLRVLVERWREDVAAGKALDDHCVFSVDELREELAAGSDTPPPKSDTLRRQLGRLRSRIRERYQQQTGVPLDDDAVVQLVGAAAYRLNPALVVDAT